MKKTRTQLYTQIRELLLNKRAYPYFALGFVAVTFLATSTFIFLSILRSLDATFEEKRVKPVLPVRVNFAAIDTIALKLGIEIPVRNIPSRTGLVLNQPPIIFNFTSIRSQILPGETITIFLNAYDPDGDTLDVRWNATGGSLNPLGPYGPARWKAPDKTGDYTITVALTDNHTGRTPVSTALGLKVIPRPAGEIPPQEIPQIATRLVGLVKEEGSPELYLVKLDRGKLFKRVVVDNKVIDFYGHINLNTVQIVPAGGLEEYILTNWIRGKDKTKVYQVNLDGAKQWYNMSFEEFETRGGSDEAIFTVNDAEVDSYPDGPDILP